VCVCVHVFAFTLIIVTKHIVIISKFVNIILQSFHH